jgi:hypothetical protein
MSDYEHFEHENAFFRKRKSLKVNAIEEVRHGSKWVPFEGDLLEPFAFGSRISETEATSGMDGAKRE